MFTLVFALIMSVPACPVDIGIARNGALFSNRFAGWYKISAKTLGSDLRGGCYNDANPLPITTVKLFIAPKAPRRTIDRVFSILKSDGWSREKITLETWKNEPDAPN